MTNNGTIPGDWKGTNDPDIMTNEKDGLIGHNIIANDNSANNSSGGKNQIKNHGTVNNDIWGSFNNGENATGGENIITNSLTGIVHHEICASYNNGKNTSGGNNTITNSGQVSYVIYGTYNQGDNASGGENTITNTGTVKCYIMANVNRGVNSRGISNTIINSGTITEDIYGDGNHGLNAIGGFNTIRNSGTVGDDIYGSFSRGEDANAGFNTIINTGTVGSGLDSHIYGSKNEGLCSVGGNNTIYNYNSVSDCIYGSYNEGHGASGGGNTIYNYGKVGGSIYGTYNVNADNSSGGTGNTIYNSGTVGGSIYAGDADDTVHIRSGSNVAGVVDGETGTDNLYYGASGMMDFATFAAKYLNFENMGLYVDGNTTLTGNWNFNLSSTVTQTGSLTLNNTISATNLNNAGTATFNGDAAFSGDVTNTGTLNVSKTFSADNFSNSGSAEFGGNTTIKGEVSNKGSMEVALSGKLSAESLSNSGTSIFNGDACFSGDVTNTGTLNVSKTFSADNFSNSGSAKFGGNTTIKGEVSNKGSMEVALSGTLNAGSLNNSGYTGISGTANISGDAFNSGRLNVQGTLNAGSLRNSGYAIINGRLNVGSLHNMSNLEINGKANVRGNTTNSGFLNVNGSLITASLKNSGIIGGSGTIFCDIINIGIISPGNSIGTLNLAQNLTFEPGSTLQAELAANGLCDLVSSSGTVIIKGGTISTYLPRDLYTDSTSWKIIKADGGVSGLFAAIEGQPDSKILSFSQANQGNSLSLVLDRKSYGSFAMGGAAETGRGLDGLVPLATKNMKNLLITMDFDQDEQELAQTLNALNPEMYTAFSAASLKAGALFDASMTRRLEELRSRRVFALETPGVSKDLTQLAASETLASGQVDQSAASGWNMWGRGLGLWANQDESQGYLGRNQTTGGAALGADYVINEHMIFGLATGASRTDLSWSSGNYDGDIEARHYGLYFQADFEGFITRLLASYTHLDNSAIRPLRFKDFSADAKGSFDADLYSAVMAVGYQARLGAWLMEPLAEINYQRLNEEGFSEGSADYLNLDIADRKTDSMLFKLGVTATRLVKIEGFEMLPRLGVAWQHQLGDERPSLDAAFAGYGAAPFTVFGAKFVNNACVAEMGLTAVLGSSLKFFADYRLGFADGYLDQALSAGLMFSF